jgi:transcriptional regulator with XRE-family HTH domain
MTAARNIQNIVGPRIREHREKAGLSQPQLVAKCNLEGWDITREMLAKIETQVRKVADFEVLCLSRALGVPVDSLVPDDRGGDKGN